MPCNCRKPKSGATNTEESSAQVQVQKVKAWCPDCDGGLIGANGMTYPVHLVPVLISNAQVEQWKQQGYPVELYVDNA